MSFETLEKTQLRRSFVWRIFSQKFNFFAPENGLWHKNFEIFGKCQTLEIFISKTKKDNRDFLMAFEKGEKT